MSEEQPPPRPKRLVLRLVVSVLIGVALAWMLVSGGLPIIPPAAGFSKVERWAAPAYFASLVGVHLVRALRWRHLLRPLGQVELRAVLGTAWVGFAAVLFLPLRVGEVAGPYLLGGHGDVKGWEAAGTVAGERVIDGLVLSAVLFAALSLTTPIDPLPDRVGELLLPVAAIPKAAYTALAGFSACFLLLGVFHFKRDWSVRLLRSTVGVVSESAAERLASIAERLAKGLSFLPSGKHFLPFAIETACYWALNAAGLWILAQGCGLTAIGFWEACVLMGCLGIGILVPSGPGFFGVYQLSVYLALAMFVQATEIAQAGAAFVFIAYCCQLSLHAIGGAIGAWLLRTGAENLATSDGAT